MDIIDKFEAIVSRVPFNLPAIRDEIDGSAECTYSDLLSITKRIAYQLDNRVPSHGRVAIFLPPNRFAYASELAAIYSGRVFCPLETTYPLDRISFCLNDFQPDLVLSDTEGCRVLKKLKFRTLDVNSLSNHELTKPRLGDLAYVIYTSGSTGVPKGVLVSRRSMNKFLEWSLKFYSVSIGERWAQFSSLGFDLSLVDLLTCVGSGGTLVPVATSMDRMFPARFVEKNEVNIWHSVPSLIPLLLQEKQKKPSCLRSLRIFSFCGEPLFPIQALSIFNEMPEVEIVNTYGPTEGTFFCTSQIVDRELCEKVSLSSLPIGNPIPGWSFNFVPSESGEGLSELLIESEYLSEGYISDTPDSRRFGISNESGLRSYRTGDMVRVLDGDIYFVQRNDRQIKIRGNRLDVSEVEYQSLKYGAEEVKAVFNNGALFLFVSGEKVKSTNELTKYLGTVLPKFAVPADIVYLKALPRNDNSKIDSARLSGLVDEKWKSVE